MNLLRWLFVSIFVLPLSAMAQTIDDIYWMTEQYPPYNYVDKSSGEIKGVSVDVLVEMFKRAGVKKNVSDLHVLPWARSYMYLKKRQDSALFSMTYTPQRLEEFKFIGPIVPTKISIIAHVSKNLTIKKLSDTDGMVIGVVRNDIGDQLLQSMGIEEGGIVRASSGENLISMLAKGRVDAIAYAEDVANYLFAQDEMNYRQYETVFTLQKSYIGYAFNKSIESSTLEPLRKALDELRVDGTLERIYSNYIGQALDY